jgi:hypothetical protein
MKRQRLDQSTAKPRPELKVEFRHASHFIGREAPSEPQVEPSSTTTQRAFLKRETTAPLFFTEATRRNHQKACLNTRRVGLSTQEFRFFYGTE